MAFNTRWANDSLVTWSDQFAGGGGAADGLERVPGTRVIQAGNHAQHAVATYRANHPHVRVECADLSQVNPAAWPRTHALWSSPECTHHTVADGKPREHGEFVDGLFSSSGVNEADIRSRATMYCIPRFAEYHQYLAIVMENVVEARWWGPKHNKGAGFDAWLNSLRVWGYKHKIFYRNSAHVAAYGPAALCSRDRMYVVLWHESVGRTPNFEKWMRPWVMCGRHGLVQAVQAWRHTDTSSPQRPWGKFGPTFQYEWRCPDKACATTMLPPVAIRGAHDAVNWNRPGRVIGSRYDGPRSANTWRKIEDGHRRYGSAPFVVEMRGGSSMHRALTEPLSTITAGGNHHLLVHGDAPDVRDRYSRMLDVEERKVAMAFPEEYRLIATAERKSDQERQLRSLVGMAVTPNVSRDIGCMITEFITGEDIEPAYPLTLAA